MDVKRIRRLLATGLIASAVLLGLSALALLSRTSQNSEQFGRLNDLLLLINAIGALVLLILIVGNLVRLLRDYRGHIPGARLKARMLAAFIVLAVAPLVIVWFFAVQFLNRGIDNWFDVEIEQGLGAALELSRNVLDVRLRDRLSRTRRIARQISKAPDSALVPTLSRLRRDAGALEITVYGDTARIVATSSRDPAALLPRPPPDDVTMQLRRSGSYVGLDSAADGGYQIRAAVRVPGRRPGSETLLLQAIYPLDKRIGALTDSVERSYTRYGELVFLREPLRYSFTFTLTLVVLLSLLAAVYGAFFFARRLVAPIQSLVAGTRAVAAGNLETRLPASSHDEVGFLIDSFNDMIQRLADAREAARGSAQQVERERARLAAILARLSTGVIATERDGSIRIANEAAGAILGVDLTGCVGQRLADIGPDHPLLAQFVDALDSHAGADATEWREELVLRDETGRRVLVCAATSLPSDEAQAGGQVLVFDDVTALLQAQRDAAWGEVARRLAHEIKNPLTPIRLSAERIRRRYLSGMQDMEAEVLDRATHTIVQQVEAMRDMVNAFSEYARAPELNISTVDLNQLVREVAYLYQSRDSQQSVLQLELDDALEPIAADAVRMRQLLHNLIRNSMEALDGRQDARLVVATRRVTDEAFVELTVQDNGPGFDAETLDQAFEPYVTTKAKGTGLGLAIVKKLVEEHGGAVIVENLAEGGACVRVRLPRRPVSRDHDERDTTMHRRRERA
ncbi:MAG TPA: HAMP domain-containing protein [Chromatiales bacterium]|nr:HAMP domain-containing protein [Chromatiales bacterium]